MMSFGVAISPPTEAPPLSATGHGAAVQTPGTLPSYFRVAFSP